MQTRTKSQDRPTRGLDSSVSLWATLSGGDLSFNAFPKTQGPDCEKQSRLGPDKVIKAMGLLVERISEDPIPAITCPLPGRMYRISASGSDTLFKDDPKLGAVFRLTTLGTGSSMVASHQVDGFGVRS